MIGRSGQMTMIVLCTVLACGSIASAVTLSGRVYEGQTGVEPPAAKAIQGATVNLYGADDAGQMGTYITHTTTDSDGWYGLWFSTRGDTTVYDYYNIVATTPATYTSEGATSLSGSVEATDWIQYEYDWLSQTTTGNKFWYQPITIMENQAPVVFAGDDLVETGPIPLPYPRPLAGAVSDDGLPEGEPLVIEWTLIDGPHGVGFEDVGDPQTTAHFHGYGTYILRLAAFDGEFEAFDEVVIEIRESATDRGGILFEWWFDLGNGTSVADLREHRRFPEQPSQSEVRTSFEGPMDWRDEYGTRVRGYIYPPATGDYTFWISSDDASELWLGMDEDPAGGVKIAHVEVWNDPHTWDTYPEQRSEPQRLVAGLPYYIEALHKEGVGGDHLAIAWGGPGIGDGPIVIDGEYLSPWILLQPVRPEQIVGVDIGGALPPGSMTLCAPPECPEGCGRVTAGGARIWGTADQFHYAYMDAEPLHRGDNFTAVVKVHSMGAPGSDGWSKAGIMVRQTLNPGSPHAMIVRTPDNGIALQGRDVQGGQSWHVPVGLAGWRIDETDTVWLRLDLAGNRVTASYAIGGEAVPTAWMASASHEVPVVGFPYPDGLLVGLATMSREQGVPITATYCNFAVGPHLGPPVLIEPGLVARYTFDEGEGTVAHDSSGFGRHGTLVGDVQWVDGPPGLGGAVRESGGGHVSIGPDDSAQIAEAISSTGRITLMAWVKMPDPPYAQWDIIHKGPDAWGLHAAQDGLGFGFRVAPGQYVEADSDVIPGLWQHVAGAYDGEGLHLYVNGELVGSKPYAGPIAENDSGIAVGQEMAGSAWKSRVRIYNEALSQGEIAGRR